MRISENSIQEICSPNILHNDDTRMKEVVILAKHHHRGKEDITNAYQNTNAYQFHPVDLRKMN